MDSSALFSTDRTYRYALMRIWDKKRDSVLFIGLNPSMADETMNDPTITRCISFAKSWGFGSICVVNLFAFCSRFPSDLYNQKNPIGRRNDYWIKHYKSITKTHIACWGNHGKLLNREEIVRSFFTKLYCFGVNKTGRPKHPLYVRADRNLIEYC